MQTIENNQQHITFHTKADWYPVTGVQYRGDLLPPLSFIQTASCSILYSLQGLQKAMVQPNIQNIVIVQTRGNKNTAAVI